MPDITINPCPFCGHDDVQIGDNPAQGLTLTKTAQVRMCGNSVCPPLATALVASNLSEMAVMRRRTA